MNQNTIVQTHPWLLKILGSKNPFFVLLAVLPALIVLLNLGEYEVFSVETLVLGLAGILYWTFFEYAMHRWPYHIHFTKKRARWFFETFHLYHHRNLNDYRVLNAGPLMIYPLLTLLVTPLYFIFSGDWNLIAPIALSLTCSYVFYENVHYFIHYKKFESGYMNYIQRFHLHHHYKNWNANFGNTSHFWDVLLGTYDPKWKNYEMDQKAISETILKK